jgi:hypothetical protein
MGRVVGGRSARTASVSRRPSPGEPSEVELLEHEPEHGGIGMRCEQAEHRVPPAAESFSNVATEVDCLDGANSYGGSPARGRRRHATLSPMTRTAPSRKP